LWEARLSRAKCLGVPLKIVQEPDAEFDSSSSFSGFSRLVGEERRERRGERREG